MTNTHSCVCCEQATHTKVMGACTTCTRSRMACQTCVGQHANALSAHFRFPVCVEFVGISVLVRNGVTGAPAELRERDLRVSRPETSIIKWRNPFYYRIGIRGVFCIQHLAIFGAVLKKGESVIISYLHPHCTP